MKANQNLFNNIKLSKPWIKITLVISLTAIVLAACATPATQATLTPTPQPLPTTSGQGGMDTLPVARAKSLLVDKLSINGAKIKFVEAQKVQWPDTCLGVQQPGIMCAFHVVDGFKIVLSANGLTYEIHTNLDGSQVVLVPPSA
ncbi:MAG: hypothetical protein PVJ21_12035 [Anaerolineales bacterium]|jgi:hypothetical protein